MHLCCCVGTVTSQDKGASLSHHFGQSHDEPCLLWWQQGHSWKASVLQSYTPNTGWLKYPCLAWWNSAFTRRHRVHPCVWATGQSFSGDTLKLWCRASSMQLSWCPFYDLHCLCPTDLTDWDGSRTFSCVFIFLCPTSKLAGVLFFWKRCSPRLPFRRGSMENSWTQSKEVAGRALLSSSPFNAALLARVVCFQDFTCCNLLAEILSFLKKVFRHILQHYSC